MRLFKKTLQPTLFLSATGVLVETLANHTFAPGGLKPRPHTEEVAAPAGSAVVAVQFTHMVGERFLGLACFRLSYHHRAPGQDLMGEYLANPFDSVQWAAVPIEASALSPDQRRVVAQLLRGSDPKAWEASAEFVAMLEGQR